MPHRRRPAHRAVWIGLSLVLPAILISAALLRPARVPGPLVERLPAAEVRP